ncbi:ABC transporter ATP-binding protein [Dinghuibacter silviterrae]|uniref:ABC-2 type transport system ATP-binding protein n=1 Tax=Dinghuibacter silviterrae TaxID=1539049 RepID=A0A4R8DIX7_9BACT|nr:ABC transporter ATP-binding protein [Dinghuibacter silviterrae]TDW97468.1 ABC-2 type transport system ATP-binding protein [Dinghuibacter silviterrae]
MEKTVVKVENLSHRYGGSQWAIKDISFDIRGKGVLGLLGSNGAGKSTTMNIICGVLNQTAGNVYINDIDVRQHPLEAKRYLGFLPQKPPLHPDLTVDEYLTYTAHLRSVPGDEVKRAVGRAKEKCGITHFSQRLVRNLSGGYQQRVGIAQAIVHMPQFVVLDEPTNGLDPNQIVEIRHLIKELATDHAVLLSTHILSEVQATCDHIKMIEHGQLVFSGTTQEFDNYIEPDALVMGLETPPSLEDILSIPGVKSAEPIEPPFIRVKFSGSTDVVKRLVEKSVQDRWQLTEIRVERSSMDEVFAELSNKKNKPK